jgi:cytosine/adenosine deaminase-related metal-dependent hydrolase
MTEPAARSRYWCEAAWLGDRVAERVLVEVAGDRITAVHSGVPCPDGAARLAGLTLPGLANGHSHAFHRALRGRTHGERGTFWGWRDRMYAVAERLDPDSYFALARAVYAEMALAGVACVGEFHYLHHGPGGTRYADPNAMGHALLAAAAEAGIRITLLDTCYLAGGIGVELSGVQRRFGDGSAAAWADRVTALAGALSADPPGGPDALGQVSAVVPATVAGPDDPPAGSAAPDRVRAVDPASAAGPPAPDRQADRTARLGVAVHSLRAVPLPDVDTVVAFAGTRRLPLHVHLSEQPAENDACLAAYGCTPTAALADRGALGPTSTAVHATHLTSVDVALLGGSGTAVCRCPTTERDLADGIGPAPELAAAGSPLTLGSDSHAVVDLFEEARAVELDERLRSGRRGHFGAAALLRAATAAGHRSLGWPEAGRIEPGTLADLVTVALDTPRTAGTDPAQAVFAATAADVRQVVVGGRQVVRDGAHLQVGNVGAALAAAIAAVVGR